MSTPSEKVVRDLKTKRAMIKSQLTKFITYLNATKNNPDIDALEVKSERLNTQHIAKLETILLELVAADPDNQAAHEAEHEALEEQYETVLIQVRKFTRRAKELESSARGSARSSATPSPTTNSSVASYGIKLHDIKPPEFDGSFEKWPAFKDIFITRIDKNENLTTVDKLQYLQASLKGKAARAIQSLECTAQNYEEAWNILTSKYDNARKTILQHWNSLHNIPRLQRDTPEALEELVDNIRQHLRAMKGLGEPIEHWNSCMIYLILQKISADNAFLWETTLDDNKIPSYKSLLDFLGKRGSCSTALSLFQTKPQETSEKNRQGFKSREHKRSPPNQPRGQSFNTITSGENAKPCVICSGAHKIYRCPAFQALTIEQRERSVQKNSLCFNCLATGHGAKECKSSSCRQCGGKHHTFLHKNTVAPSTLPPPSQASTST